jgi:hypothetical protein
MIGAKLNEDIPSDYCWGSLLQKKYPDIKVHNFAGPGRCNQEIFRDFLEFSESDPGPKENTVVFFQITNPDRIEILNGSDDTASYVLSNADMHEDHVGQAVRSYIKNLYHPKIGENLGFMTMLSAYALAKLQRICKFYWSGGRFSYPKETYHFLLSANELKRQNILDIRNMVFSSTFWDEEDRRHRSPDNHINELGHQAYFDRIIDPIIQQHLK